MLGRKFALFPESKSIGGTPRDLRMIFSFSSIEL